VEPFLVFILGPAGTGKTTFASSFGDFVEAQRVPVIRVNLDPAVENLPYVPDIDVREYVFARKVMEEYGLGPNGSIIASIDLLLEHIDEINERIDDEGEGYILIDTPGQMEVFVFRRSGEEIAKKLIKDKRAAAVFIHDILLALSPSSFISQTFLAAATYYRIKIPFLNLFNKIDLVERNQLERVQEWVSDNLSLLSALESEVSGSVRLLSLDLARALSDFFSIFSLYFVSSTKMRGFNDVFAELQRIYTGGDITD